MVRCGSLWIVLGSLWVVVDRCGWFWVVLGRFGSFWVVPRFSNYVRNTDLPNVIEAVEAQISAIEKMLWLVKCREFKCVYTMTKI